jgi:hypothetical protein
MPIDHDYIPPMAYSDRDAKGRATAASTYPLGIGLPYDVLTPTQSRIRVLASDGDWEKPKARQVVRIGLPETGDPFYRSIAFAESLLRASVDYWKAAWAEINRVAFIDAVHPEGDGARIGWRTYIGDPAPIKRLPSDVVSERIAPGGVLVKLRGDAFDPGDPAQIAEARRIRAALVGDGSPGSPNYLRVAPDAEVIGRGLPEIPV